MTQLARKLGFVDYFALGFGTIVGVGWLVVMGDWLQRGGPLGAILGFLIGGIALLPIGYVYGRLVMLLPDAAGEIAYTAEVFPKTISFVTGWMILLPFLIACPWFAVAIGKIAAYLFPAFNSHEIYRLGGHPIYLPHLLLGLLLTVLITSVNYRGVQLSAKLQSAATLGLFLLFIVFASAGVTHGTAENLRPWFNGSPFVAVLLVLQVVPYFMTGFECIGKASEESRAGFRGRDYLLATVFSIAIGALFYAAVIAIVAVAQPWRGIAKQEFATAVALERAVGGRAIVDVVLLAALVSLAKAFNGAFVAATRLLFALGRRGLATERLSRLHPQNQTPVVAVLVVGTVTAAAMSLGDTILVPVTEVGSLGSVFAWTMSCLSYAFMVKATARTNSVPALNHTIERVMAATGLIIAAALLVLKLLPVVPGHFTQYEYAALLGWLLIGIAVRCSAFQGTSTKRGAAAKAE
ncbi:MAG: APC family permease [Terriglobales bacterium]|jgi:amino acid transporter